jgi:hypothetical protein
MEVFARKIAVRYGAREAWIHEFIRSKNCNGVTVCQAIFGVLVSLSFIQMVREGHPAMFLNVPIKSQDLLLGETTY